MEHADQFDALHTMHALMEDAVQVGRGEIAPAKLWDDLQQRYPELLAAG